MVLPTLQHDPIGQLTAYGGTQFSYDTRGNRTAQGLVYGAGNRLLSDTIWDYTYDNEGNLTSRIAQQGGESWLYSYDHLNRLIGVEHWQLVLGVNVKVADVDYRYDPWGHKVETVAEWLDNGILKTATTRSLYEGDQLWADVAGGQIKVRYVTDPYRDVLVARLDKDADNQPRLLWYVTDKQGSVIALVDNGGAAEKRLRYGGFKQQTVWWPEAGVIQGLGPQQRRHLDADELDPLAGRRL